MTLGVEVRRRDARERGISMRRVFQPFSESAMRMRMNACRARFDDDYDARVVRD